jgi:hypothetical protein
MRLSRLGLVVAALAAAVMVAQPVAAQYGEPRGGGKQPAGNQPSTPKGATCVPSGFAKLRRNCNVNVGGCQRMPDSCSKGWCCP